MRCNNVRREDVEKCHVCAYRLRIICLGCGAGLEEGDHECKTVTIPAHPLWAENMRLRTELGTPRSTAVLAAVLMLLGGIIGGMIVWTFTK